MKSESSQIGKIRLGLKSPAAGSVLKTGPRFDSRPRGKRDERCDSHSLSMR